MKKLPTHRIFRFLPIIVLIIASMACQIWDVAKLVHGTVFEAGSDLFDQFYGEPKLTIHDTPDMSAIEGLDDLNQEEGSPGDILFIGTSDYLSFFWRVQCPGHQTSENFLSMLILEDGTVTGKLWYKYNTGSCEYPENGQTYTQIWEYNITGRFEGKLIGDAGTITYYEDIYCEIIYDSTGKDLSDEKGDCTLWPERVADITLSGNQVTGLIRAPGGEDPQGLFDVLFTASPE